MTTLFDDTLIGREFGSRLLSVARFRQWLAANRREVVTNPDLDGFQFVQVEALLCALERGAIENLSHEVAASIPTATPMPDAKTADIASRWKVGADAHNQWRGLIQAAVQTGDLVLLHFSSKLPIEPAQKSIQSRKRLNDLPA